MICTTISDVGHKDGFRVSEVAEALYLRTSTIPNSGYGLFTRHTIPRNTHIIQYTGERISWREFHKRYNETNPPVYVLELKGEILIDARDPSLSNLSRFANHKPFEASNVRVTNNGWFVSKRLIKAGHELFIDYSRHYWAGRNKMAEPTVLSIATPVTPVKAAAAAAAAAETASSEAAIDVKSQTKSNKRKENALTTAIAHFAEKHGLSTTKWDRSAADKFCTDHDIKFEFLQRRVMGWKNNKKVPEAVISIFTGSRLAELTNQKKFGAGGGGGGSGGSGSGSRGDGNSSTQTIPTSSTTTKRRKTPNQRFNDGDGEGHTVVDDDDTEDELTPSTTKTTTPNRASKRVKTLPAAAVAAASAAAIAVPPPSPSPPPSSSAAAVVVAADTSPLFQLTNVLFPPPLLIETPQLKRAKAAVEQAEKHAQFLRDAKTQEAAIAALDNKIAAARAAIEADEKSRTKAAAILKQLRKSADDANESFERMFSLPAAAAAAASQPASVSASTSSSAAAAATTGSALNISLSQ